MSEVIDTATMDLEKYADLLLKLDEATDKIAEIGQFGISVYNLSSQYPIVYGILSIFIALSAGIFVSYIRRRISIKINSPKSTPPKAI